MNKSDIPVAQYAFSGNEVTAIVDSALESLLWSEGEISDSEGNLTLEMWDDIYTYGDATPELRAAITAEVNALDDLDNPYGDAAHYYFEQRLGDFGHDMTLTRNGHGAGFWDRGLGELGDVLTDWAHHLGTLHVFHGSDAVEPHGTQWAGMFHAE